MSRIDRGPSEEAVLNPYFTDERMLKNAVMRAEQAEAELKDADDAIVLYRQRAEYAEAALAERGKDFACNRWTARAKEGGET